MTDSKAMQYLFSSSEEKRLFYKALDRYGISSGAGFVRACVRAIIAADEAETNLVIPLRFETAASMATI